MPDTAKPAAEADADKPATPPRRHPGHRGQDVRDTVAEMAAKAHEISLEAGSKMAAAMKEVVGAAAGITAFGIESARDLVQYMVRRGQMTQDEADKLIVEAEQAWMKKNKGKLPPRVTDAPEKKSAAAEKKPVAKKANGNGAHAAAKASPKPVAAKKPAKAQKAAPAKKPAAKKAAPKK